MAVGTWEMELSMLLEADGTGRVEGEEVRNARNNHRS